MENWKCPLEYIDKDIREVVHVLYESGMKPFMSCSGSYRDHQNENHEGVVITSADVEFLDSENARELIAMLIGDRRFKCSIMKAGAKTFYDNDLPEGIRFGIEFENVLGDNQDELRGIIEDVIAGKRADVANRNKVDMVCDMLSKFNVKYRNKISFAFNDENVIPGKENENNYSIEVADRKDFSDFYNKHNEALTGFSQDAYSAKFFGEDFITTMAFLKKLEIDYKKIPVIKHEPKVVKDNKRENKYFWGREGKVEKLEQMEHEIMLDEQMHSKFSVEDLLAMFQDDDEGEI